MLGQTFHFLKNILKLLKVNFPVSGIHAMGQQCKYIVFHCSIYDLINILTI